MTQKFAIAPNSHRGNPNSPVNRWYRDCQAANVPFIYVYTGKKYAEVTVDFFSLSHQAEEKLRRHTEELVARQEALYDRYATPGKSGADIRGVLASYSKFEIEQAKLLAEAIFDLFLEVLARPDEQPIEAVVEAPLK